MLVLEGLNKRIVTLVLLLLVGSLIGGHSVVKTVRKDKYLTGVIQVRKMQHEEVQQKF